MQANGACQLHCINADVCKMDSGISVAGTGDLHGTTEERAVLTPPHPPVITAHGAQSNAQEHCQSSVSHSVPSSPKSKQKSI